MSANDDEFDFVNPEEEANLNNEGVEEEEGEGIGVEQDERGGGRRGPDIAWREVDRYIMFIIVIIIAGLIITENLIIVFFSGLIHESSFWRLTCPPSSRVST